MTQRYLGTDSTVAHLFVVECVGWSHEAWEHLHAFQQRLIEVPIQVGIGQPPVPVLHNVATIHNLTKDVAQVIPWYLSGVQQENNL